MSIGEIDENGLIIYEPKEYDIEWIGMMQEKHKLSSTDTGLLMDIMDRGATQTQAEKTLLKLKELAIEKKTEGLNELVKPEEPEVSEVEDE
jgi:hypothetical protein